MYPGLAHGGYSGTEDEIMTTNTKYVIFCTSDRGAYVRLRLC